MKLNKASTETKSLFSINRAADLLERDRATLVRALRRVPPDGYSKQGRPRWHMPTIVGALALKSQERRETGKYRDRFSVGWSAALAGLRIMFERQITAIAAETSPDDRRATAVALAPLIERYQRTFLDISRSLGIADEDELGARADLILEEMVGEVAEAVGCDGDPGFFAEMVRAMSAEAD
ncbi:hypothetical protein RAD15_17595 [Bradyrhizobium sp. 14AA]